MRKISIIISPATILKFHNLLKKRKYRLLFSFGKSGRKPGPKGPSREIIVAVLEMKRRNPRIGCPKIVEFISKTFDIELNKDVVRRILSKYYKVSPHNNGPSWLTFMGHMKDSLWSLDFFRVESIILKTHWIMIVMDQYTRRIIGFAVEASDALDGQSACRMFNQIVFYLNLPKYLSSDHDPLFKYYQWQANLRICEIQSIKSIPYTPVSHPFIERLIGTVRREYLDNVLFFGSCDLEKKLNEFKAYYNTYRIHSSLRTTPSDMAQESTLKKANIKHFKWKSHCRDLFQTPMAA